MTATENRINRIKPDRNAPIGVFDSGVGGLTVVREIMRQIPNEKIIYFGDTARVLPTAANPGRLSYVFPNKL